jgi:pantoate--beta-alanine ligase
VATVVLKLFNIVRPHLAIFGEKDFQQLAVIRQMVRDLDVPVEIVPLATVREADGLAMSSRNSYLSPDNRRRAAALYQGLSAAKALRGTGEARASVLVNAARELIQPRVDSLDYLEVRDATTLAPLTTIEGPAVILVAAFIGGTRLIDNLRI